jgi:tetratricopeptide (TPR) repeat protein
MQLVLRFHLRLIIYLFCIILATTAFAQNRNLQTLIDQLRANLPTAKDPASTFARLGLLYLRLEKADSAEASFQNALTVRPDLAIAHTGLGRVYMDLRKKPDKALPHFEKAVEIDTTDIDTHDRLIHTLLALEHTGGRARKIASKTIARFRRHYISHDRPSRFALTRPSTHTKTRPRRCFGSIPPLYKNPS